MTELNRIDCKATGKAKCFVQTSESSTRQLITHLPQWLACAYVAFNIP